MSLNPTFLRLLCLMLAGFAVSLLAAQEEQAHVETALYTNAISDGAWQANSNVFSCSLEHEIPYYGTALFRTRAGERSAFVLQERTSRFEPGEAEIVAVSPAWRQTASKQVLGHVPAKRGTTPMWLDADWAEAILLALYEGAEVEISQKAWYQKDADQLTRLVITPIGFRPAYDRYLRCLKSLLPANFEQMKRSAIYFPQGEAEEIPDAEARKLDRILQIVKHDKNVRAFYVDGHTDSEGDRAENLEISKARAALVADYLKRRGVPEDWITLRWHGERYPVAANATESGKARNRRVTVRIERVQEIDVLPLENERAE